MEIIFVAAVLGVFLNRLEHRNRHAATICLWCPDVVHYTGKLWVHADGRQYHPLGRTSAFHPACPDRSLMGVP